MPYYASRHPTPDPLLVRELTQRQEELRAQVREAPLPPLIRTVAGCDSSFPSPDTILSVVVLLSWPDLRQLHVAWHRGPVEVPYVPGFLAFREVPNLLRAYAKLPEEPHVLLVDGHGRAHPRRMGIATQLGVTLDKPTLGVAKQRLTGSYQEPGPLPGDTSPLLARASSTEIIGEVLRTRVGVLPVFISPGHLCDQAGATALAKACMRGYKLPEPTRLADQWAARLKSAPV